MVNDDQSTLNQRDCVVTQRTNDGKFPLESINVNMYFYDPLGYPLMHIDGQGGWLFGTFEKNSVSKNN